ncbi:hypothetical protein KEH51_03320 [[Brevibacterium] frigoritolerans]|uniref:Uncharacterized protein n=1 Tax=Peribacillus frigoritolerans TaxID=450367 RepID=A0A941J219_9BACI|nr:hypothetical protein [Peribacillus frigoritolerans]
MEQVCETPAGIASQGETPRASAPRRLPERPRKASAWVEINVQIVQTPKKM